MILLLGFRASGVPEDDDTQYQATELDAWRIVRLLEPGQSRRRNPVVFVTIYSEDLTSENCIDNLQEGRDASRGANEQVDLYGE